MDIMRRDWRRIWTLSFPESATAAQPVTAQPAVRHGGATGDPADAAGLVELARVDALAAKLGKEGPAPVKQLTALYVWFSAPNKVWFSAPMTL